MDLGQDLNAANALYDAVNNFVAANPQRNLPALPSEMKSALKLQLDRVNAFGTGSDEVLSQIANNASIAAFLESPQGRYWADQASGQNIGHKLQVIKDNIGDTALGAAILNDPEKLALVLEVKNNAGNVIDLANLIKANGAATRFDTGDGTVQTLSADEVAGNISIERLKALLVHGAEQKLDDASG